MRIREIIKETTLTELTVDPGITAALVKKGYREVGHGADQLVFLEPGSKMILKIFGTNKVAKSGTLSYPQKSFVAFAQYCEANPDNQFLPYFSGWETFEFKGQSYLQIRTERLFDDASIKNIMYALEQIVEKSAAILHYQQLKFYGKWIAIELTILGMRMTRITPTALLASNQLCL